MKKTLFLTMLGAVFCSAAVAETTEVTVKGQTYQANMNSRLGFS